MASCKRRLVINELLKFISILGKNTVDSFVRWLDALHTIYLCILKSEILARNNKLFDLIYSLSVSMRLVCVTCV